MNKNTQMLKKPTTGWEKPFQPQIDSAHLWRKPHKKHPPQHADPKPPPIFISGVANIKPLIELLNVIAPNKYLVKTLPNGQVWVQPTESPIYTTIIKALMEKNTEFHT